MNSLSYQVGLEVGENFSPQIGDGSPPPAKGELEGVGCLGFVELVKYTPLSPPLAGGKKVGFPF